MKAPLIFGSKGSKSRISYFGSNIARISICHNTPGVCLEGVVFLRPGPERYRTFARKLHMNCPWSKIYQRQEMQILCTLCFDGFV
jgi:hypothetical protein